MIPSLGLGFVTSKLQMGVINKALENQGHVGRISAEEAKKIAEPGYPPKAQINVPTCVHVLYSV